MTLLGDRAWALPSWLDRVLPRISLEGEPEPAPAG
jgi:RND superfamily putative drug exporter